MDPLSDLLSLMRLRSYASFGFDFGGAWSIAFGPHEGIKLYALVSGACWLSVEGVPEPIRVEAGDCLVLPGGRSYRVCSDLALAPVDALAVLPAAGDGGVTTIQGGGDLFGLGGAFTLAGDQADLLLGALPPVLHVRDEPGRAALRWTLDRMRRELREPRPGGFLVAQQLALMVLVEALRLHMARGAQEAGEGGVGWLFALADGRLRAAIAAIHADPARRWTVRSLAERAGMSRTSFAVRFKAVVGRPPMEHLTRWRMMLAGDRLRTTREPISVIAPSLGYESESAFGAAFKRVTGRSPRQHRGG